MRLAPRLAASITALALIAAGCGGSSVAYREVPGGPPELKVPGSGAGFSSAATPTPTVDPDATETPDADAEETPTPEAGTGEEATGATGTTEGGTEAPPTEEAPPTNTTPETGTPPDGLEDYCAENPGAC
ncbi:hypothetical protein OJ997_06280 [Solirubrobacter phytolaccae]|uniref:Uncharacterized protein n=1 Tax=Solirubrobacter phytolaccae TaxID=1404360 RepID=A0A9X3N7I6_9ACTN|nr:hypothetical protein [Solirubrobacter phytolaccae]MDA0179895.1 hypothetical protein [Solirubrobacter phytolaccae]